jgi:hypothetical protein
MHIYEEVVLTALRASFIAYIFKICLADTFLDIVRLKKICKNTNKRNKITNAFEWLRFLANNQTIVSELIPPLLF